MTNQNYQQDHSHENDMSRERSWGKEDDRFSRTQRDNEDSNYDSQGTRSRSDWRQHRRGGNERGGYPGGDYDDGGPRYDPGQDEYRRGSGSNGGNGGQYGPGWDTGRRGYGNRGGQTGGEYSGQAGPGGDMWSGEGRGQNDQSHRGRGPKSYQRSDDRICDDVCDRLSDDHDLDASEIEVSVSDREVTLSGEVDSKQAKRRAEDCCDSVSGVEHVQNNLRVKKSQGKSDSEQTDKTKK